jgi:alpha-1,6-mannosyltransferase
MPDRLADARLAPAARRDRDAAGLDLPRPSRTVYGLGVVLVAVVAFGPAIRPWYVLWGLAPLAATAGHRRVRGLLAALCAGLVLAVLPDGFAANADRVLLAVLGALIGIAAFLPVRLLVAPATPSPAWTGPGRRTPR